MNTHKNANKQGEKILLGGVAAAALGLINAKPQTVKAANQNGTRATKKTARRAVKTKLNYQTEATETSSKTVGETATADNPTNQKSDNQAADSETNAGTGSIGISSNTSKTGQDQADVNNSSASENNQDTTAGNTSSSGTKDSIKTEKLEKDVKRDSGNPTILTGVWLGVDVTYQPGLGIFTVKGNNQTINTINDRSTSILQARDGSDPLDEPLFSDRYQIKEVCFEGSLTINGTVQSMFDTLPNLTTVTGLENLNTSNVYSMYGMFANCSSLSSIEGINKLDASKVTDMSYMFENCGSLTSLDLSGLNIGLNINKNGNKDDPITMKEMFRDCTNLANLILPDKIDTSQFTDMTGMFYGCSNLDSVSYPSSNNSADPENPKVDLTKFNTNSLQYMDHMFSKCYSITDLDLSSFDTGNVTLMDDAFSECRSLTALNIANFNMARVEHYVSLSNLLNKLPNLNKLVLGKNCRFTSEDKTAGLDTPGTWVNVGNGTEGDPEMSKKWSSTDLMNNYNGETDHDTYIRFYDGYPVKIHYMYLDKEGKRQPILDKDGKSYDYVVAGDNGKTSDPINTRNIYGYTINSIFVNNDKQSSTDKVTVTFTDQEQDVYFVYDRAKGNSITVNYLYYVDDKGHTKPLLDKDNKPMTEEVDGVLYGDQKDIIPKSVPGYTIKQININGAKQPGTDKATVGYSEKEQNVDFIYERKQGKSITVNYLYYVDDKGHTKPLLDKDNKPMTEEVDGVLYGDQKDIIPKQLSGYTIKQININGAKQPGTDKATVGYSEKEQNVDFIYERKQGKSITVNYLYYVDDKGHTKPLLDKDNKPMTEEVDGVLYGDQKDIIPKQLSGYTIKQININGVKQSGTDKATVGYSDKKQNVDLVYERKQGKSITVNYLYLDDKGHTKPILDKDNKPMTENIAGVLYGDQKDIIPKQLFGYTTKQINIDGVKQPGTDKATVGYSEKEQNVDFVYERKQGKSITVNYLYLDDKGHTKPLLDKDNKPMKENVAGVLYGDQKDIIPKSVPGYTIKQININGAKQPGTDKATVGYSEKEQNVDFIYTKKPDTNNPNTNKVRAADVTVHYKDEFGNTIAPDEILSGYVGDGYTTEAKNISGYTLKTRPDNATGLFSTFPQDVTYIYTTIGTNKTPNINEPTTPTTPNTPSKTPKENNRKVKNDKENKKRKKTKAFKPTANNNLSQKQGSSNVAKSQKTAALPQTGTNKHSSLAMLALGSLTLVGALSAAWFSRKKIK